MCVAVKANKCVASVQGTLIACNFESPEPLPSHAYFAFAVWYVTVNCAAKMEGRLIPIIVPTRAAAAVVNRACSSCVLIRPAIRQMWKI